MVRIEAAIIPIPAKKLNIRVQRTPSRVNVRSILYSIDGFSKLFQLRVLIFSSEIKVFKYLNISKCEAKISENQYSKDWVSLECTRHTKGNAARKASLSTYSALEPSLSARQDIPRSFPGEFPLLDNGDSVDENIGDTFGMLMWLENGGCIANLVEVEYHNICTVSFSEHSPVAEAHDLGRKRCG
jgi:hypothetical protein